MGGLTVVGRFTKIYGEGISINLYDNFPVQFTLEEPLFVIIDKLEVPLFLNNFQKKGRSSAVVSIDDIDTELRMSELLTMEVYLPDAEDNAEYDDPSDDAIYFEDLEGWTAILTEQISGEIIKFLDGDNPLFMLKVGDKEVFIPAQDEFFADFDEDNQIVYFTLPEGLLDLYL